VSTEVIGDAALDFDTVGEVAPRMPDAERLHLPGRGTLTVRREHGPPGSPTVLLLHGWVATGALNWFRAFGPLHAHFGVVAPDLRGHGGGIRSRKRFTIADCADDTAALVEKLECGPVIAVGYSMGGAVAQQLWRRHPDLVGGLVLAATGTEYVRGNRERYVWSAIASALAGTTRLGSAVSWLPAGVARRIAAMPVGRGGAGLAQWARKEMSSHNMRMLLEAGHAIATYSSKAWIHEIDVPTSVIITEEDAAVSPLGQFRMAMAIPKAHINRLEGGHVAAAFPDFGRKITDSCLDVQRRRSLS